MEFKETSFKRFKYLSENKFGQSTQERGACKNKGFIIAMIIIKEWENSYLLMNQVIQRLTSHKQRKKEKENGLIKKNQLNTDQHKRILCFSLFVSSSLSTQ